MGVSERECVWAKGRSPQSESRTESGRITWKRPGENTGVLLVHDSPIIARVSSVVSSM